MRSVLLLYGLCLFEVMSKKSKDFLPCFLNYSMIDTVHEDL